MAQTIKQQIGTWGEDEAVQFLEGEGYTIVERNFRVRLGEIDIIAWNDKPHFGATLCFVEVKTRGYGVGSAERATGREKLERLFSAARYYCKARGINPDATPIQFEQVSVYGSPGQVREVKHHVIPI